MRKYWTISIAAALAALPAAAIAAETWVAVAEDAGMRFEYDAQSVATQSGRTSVWARRTAVVAEGAVPDGAQVRTRWTIDCAAGAAAIVEIRELGGDGAVLRANTRTAAEAPFRPMQAGSFIQQVAVRVCPFDPAAQPSAAPQPARR